MTESRRKSRPGAEITGGRNDCSRIEKVRFLAENGKHDETVAAAKKYLDTVNDGEANAAATKELIAAIEKNCTCERALDILKGKDYLAKKSVWAFGGDGWAYDIGFGFVEVYVNLWLQHSSMETFCCYISNHPVAYDVYRAST